VSTGSGTELKTVDKSALRVLFVEDNATDVDLILGAGDALVFVNPDFVPAIPAARFVCC
jgi:hypothetical protein